MGFVKYKQRFVPTSMHAITTVFMRWRTVRLKVKSDTMTTFSVLPPFKRTIKKHDTPSPKNNCNWYTETVDLQTTESCYTSDVAGYKKPQPIR